MVLSILGQGFDPPHLHQIHYFNPIIYTITQSKNFSYLTYNYYLSQYSISITRPPRYFLFVVCVLTPKFKENLFMMKIFWK